VRERFFVLRWFVIDGVLELLGMGVASGHYRRPLSDAQIGLPQLKAVLASQTNEPLDRRMHRLGAGREDDGLGLYGHVHRHPLEIARPQRAARRLHALRRTLKAAFRAMEMDECVNKRETAMRTRTHIPDSSKVDALVSALKLIRSANIQAKRDQYS